MIHALRTEGEQELLLKGSVGCTEMQIMESLSLKPNIQSPSNEIFRQLGPKVSAYICVVYSPPKHGPNLHILWISWEPTGFVQTAGWRSCHISIGSNIHHSNTKCIEISWKYRGNIMEISWKYHKHVIAFLACS